MWLKRLLNLLRSSFFTWYENLCTFHRFPLGDLILIFSFTYERKKTYNASLHLTMKSIWKSKFITSFQTQRYHWTVFSTSHPELWAQGHSLESNLFASHSLLSLPCTYRSFSYKIQPIYYTIIKRIHTKNLEHLRLHLYCNLT